MVLQMYTASFIWSFFMLFTLIAFFRNRISIYYFLMFSTVLISNLGYMQLSSASTLEAAIFANQTGYLGSSFSPFFLLLCVADLCKVKLKRYVYYIFGLCGGVIFFFSSSIGVIDWYYKSVELVQNNGVGFLMKDYGPMHILFPLYLILLTCICFGCILHAVLYKKDVSYNTAAWLFVCMLLTVVTYAVEKIMHLDVELVPIAYAVAELGVVFLLRRISLFDVSMISAASMVNSIADGFVVCDSNGRFLGADEAAKMWFPELSELRVDVMIKSEDTDLLRQIGKWVRGEERRDEVHIKAGSIIIDAKHMILQEQRDKEIHCIYLRDDTKQHQYQELIEGYNEHLARDVNAKTERLRQVHNDILVSMANIVENRDSNTGGHIVRTSDVVKIFVDSLKKKQVIKGMSEEVANSIVKAAPLHDFGKIAISDRILNKPGKFDPEEYEEMKKHAAKGAVIVERILQNSDETLFKNIAVNVAHYHHEKWDGTGYPEGLKEKEIPFAARVMALADVFDALVSKRVYKERMSYDQAFKIIEESSGTYFDPILCTAFLACRPELEALYDSYEEEPI